MSQSDEVLLEINDHIGVITLNAPGRMNTISGRMLDQLSEKFLRGILPESGGTWLLPRIVGYAKAAQIAFTGRTLPADECLELGLVNSVVPADQLMDAAFELAGEIAANAPLAVRAIKRMMRAAETETFEQNVHHVFLQLLPLFRKVLRHLLKNEHRISLVASSSERQPLAIDLALLHPVRARREVSQ